MVNRTPEIVICLLIIISVVFIYYMSGLLRRVVYIEGGPGSIMEEPPGIEDTWPYRLCLNILGYASIFIPGYLIYKYVQNSNYVEKHGFLPYFVKLCIKGPDVIIGSETNTKNDNTINRSSLQEAILILFCFFGLQITYLTWGILQEKIMTQEYQNSDGLKGYFKDSQFLVFVNRILAFLFSGIYILTHNQPRHTAPYYKYVYCSFSNIMSSWCQYEALKYVSFPTQVLSKASKIIPVMIMGKFVSKKKYEYYEYVTAILISIGMVFFLLGSAEGHKGDTVTTFSGLILLASYMLFDSFTSNWQGALFTTYNMSSIQMMCGVNLFSCLFTTVSLIQQGGFVQSLNFMTQFPKFMYDCLLLTACSTAGQLFIYYTISTFGPVVFVIIMTIRQGLAILLSCILYGHTVTTVGIFGILIVFVAVFLRIYCNHRLKAIRRLQMATNKS